MKVCFGYCLGSLYCQLMIVITLTVYCRCRCRWGLIVSSCGPSDRCLYHRQIHVLCTGVSWVCKAGQSANDGPVPQGV